MRYCCFDACHCVCFMITIIRVFPLLRSLLHSATSTKQAPFFLSSFLLLSSPFSLFFSPLLVSKTLQKPTVFETSHYMSYFVSSHTSFSVIPLSQSYLFLSHTSFSVIPLSQSYLFLSHTSFSVIIPRHRVIAFYVIYTLLFPLFHLSLPFFL